MTSWADFESPSQFCFKTQAENNLAVTYTETIFTPPFDENDLGEIDIISNSVALIDEQLKAVRASRLDAIKTPIIGSLAPLESATFRALLTLRLCGSVGKDVSQLFYIVSRHDYGLPSDLHSSWEALQKKLEAELRDLCNALDMEPVVEFGRMAMWTKKYGRYPYISLLFFILGMVIAVVIASLPTEGQTKFWIAVVIAVLSFLVAFVAWLSGPGAAHWFHEAQTRIDALDQQ